MLECIRLEHFKCFERLDLPLAPLTLLSGFNASGKSTTIQALALLHQTLIENPTSPALLLNGETLALGSANEVMDKLSGRRSFSIGVDHQVVSATWQMLVEAENMVAPFSNVSVTTEQQAIQVSETPFVLAGNQETQAVISPLLETIRSLTYICADRIGPRETYPASSSAQQVGVGARGEYTPWFINQYESLELPVTMCMDGVAPQLKRQVEAWLASFFPGAALEIERLQRTSLLTMRFRTNEATDFYRASNVGYGLSHVLPVLTACLGAVGFAKRDAQLAPLVLVENPELHLHPAGQAAIGVFLARAAASGAQVVVETHSDHVLNGIRRAVKGIDGLPIVSPEQVALYFFQARDPERQQPQVIAPKIDRHGNLDHWPAGFFDQFDKDVEALINW
jgi:predicted ATPase